MMDYLQTDLPELILAAGQNRALCPLDRSAAQITVGSGLEYLVECLVWRNEEGDKAAISLLAGLALHMPDMALNHARSKNASNGGKGKAAKWAAKIRTLGCGRSLMPHGLSWMQSALSVSAMNDLG